MSLGDFYGMAAIMFSNPMSYAMFVLCATTIFILELGAQCVQSMLYPDPCTIVREVKRMSSDAVWSPLLALGSESVAVDSTFEVEKGASRTTGAEEEEDDVFFEEDHGLLPTNKNAIAATEEDNAMGQLLSSFAFSYPTLESATQVDRIRPSLLHTFDCLPTDTRTKRIPGQAQEECEPNETLLVWKLTQVRRSERGRRKWIPTRA